MPRKKVTKPTFKPTDEERKLVEQMCAVGIPQESICLVIRDGIDSKTLRKHFRTELDTAKIKANATIGGKLFNKAIAGDTACLIFWAKTQMGWRELSVHEVTGKDGAPLNPPSMSAAEALKMIAEFHRDSPTQSD